MDAAAAKKPKLTPKERKCVERKLKLLKKERKPLAQALAIAYQHCAPSKARSKKTAEIAERVAGRVARISALGALWSRLRQSWSRFMQVLKPVETATVDDLEEIKNVVTQFGPIPLAIAKHLEEAQVLVRGTYPVLQRAHDQILAAATPESETDIKKGKDRARMYRDNLLKIKEASWLLYDFARRVFGPR